jgi:hypothetical protein
MIKEYVIWGIPPGADQESILLCNPGGHAITDSSLLDGYKSKLSELGCNSLRVQEIDFCKPLESHWTDRRLVNI